MRLALHFQPRLFQCRIALGNGLRLFFQFLVGHLQFLLLHFQSFRLVLQFLVGLLEFFMLHLQLFALALRFLQQVVYLFTVRRGIHRYAHGLYGLLQELHFFIGIGAELSQFDHAEHFAFELERGDHDVGGCGVHQTG